MTPTTDIAKARSSVPALANTPALEIDQNDVALPRVKIAQYSTPQVQDELVPAGGIFVTTGDGDADVAYDAAGSSKLKKGLLVHVLSMYKRKSLSTEGELETWAFDDPEAPAEAWVTYNYVVCLPEIDDSLPHKWLFTRSAAPAAKQINMALVKHSGPAHEVAFRVTTKRKTKDDYKWFVPVIATAEATKPNIAKAEELAQLVAGRPQEAPSAAKRADEPEI